MKFPDNSELWVPYIPTDAQLRREVRTLSVFGRLADGVTKEQASAEVDAIARGILAAQPELAKSAVGGQVETLKERFLNGAAPRMFVVIMGAVVFVLLIACANVATLLLSRVMYRSREVAVRYALGATRWRIIRQLLIESVALASIGAVLGLALASAGVRAFDAAISATGAPYWLRFTIDYRVVLYVAGICVATGILFGLAPALQVSREQTHETLKDGTRGAAGNRKSGRLSSTLVVAELALTMVLLCGAGLMLRSFIALYAMPPGFELNGLTHMGMQLPPSNYPTADARMRFYEQLLPKVSAIPGVQRAALTTAVPPIDQEEWFFEIDGRSYGENERRPFVSTVLVTPGYFDVLGVAIARGRGLTDADGAPGAEHVVISQVMADRFFRGEDPIGRRIRFLPRDDEAALVPSWVTVVGVSAPFLQGQDDEAFRSAVVFLPMRAAPSRTASLVVRSAMPPISVMTAVRAAVQSLDADQPIFSIRTVAEVFAFERSIYRILATLFTVLALIGLTLSAVGVYGVMAYAVAQRTQEIGIRMAVGAGRRNVAWLFLKRGLAQLTIAASIGLPAALALSIVAQFRLVEVEPTDPLTFASVVMVLGAVAIAATLIPVRKAARVDPVVALRSE
jgi:predicted permease